MDAVQVSKVISCKKSKELIRKLETLTNEYEDKLLQRNVFIYNRSKMDKMQQVQTIEKERVGRERFQKFDLAEFAKLVLERK